MVQYTGAFKIRHWSWDAALSSALDYAYDKTHYILHYWPVPDYIISNVPQGSVIGPLLSLIILQYLKTKQENVHVQIKRFADDCDIYSEIAFCLDHLKLTSALLKKKWMDRM